MMKYRRAAILLLVVALVEAGLLAVLGWRNAARFFDGGRMGAVAHRLFGRPASVSGAVWQPQAVMEDTDADIQEIHARIARLFDELSAGMNMNQSVRNTSTSAGGRMPADFYRLQREIDRIFNSTFDAGPWRHALHPRDWRCEPAAVFPGLSMTEDAAAYEVTVALNDMDPLGVDIQLQGEVLLIKARGVQGSYVTRLRLPGPADAEHISAQYDGNLLRVRVPKAERQETLAVPGQMI